MKRLVLILALIVVFYGCGKKTFLMPEFSYPLEKKGDITLDESLKAFTCGAAITSGNQLVIFDSVIREQKKLEIEISKIIHRKNQVILELKDGTSLILTPEGLKKKEESESGVFVEKNQIFRKLKGKRLWKKEFDSKLAPPLIYRNLVFLGSENKFVYALKISNGKVKWKMRVGGAIKASPEVFQDMICFACLDGNLYCFHWKKGDLLWVKRLGGRGYYSPIKAGDLLIAASYSKQILFFDSSGKKTGAYNLPFELSYPPCYRKGKLYIAYYDYEEKKTHLLVLESKIAVELEIEPQPPLFAGDAFTLKAKVIGLSEPEVIFKVNGKVLQKGDLTKYVWVPEKNGDFLLEVEAKRGDFIIKSSKKVYVYSREEYRKEELLKWQQKCYWNKF
jgi:hypothetical protein